MLKQYNYIMIGALILFFGQTIGAAALPVPSGQIVNGFRVLSVTDHQPEFYLVDQ